MDHHYKTPKTVPLKHVNMVQYLKGHPRHDIDASGHTWSYARSIKIRYMKFPDKATEERAWDIACGEDNSWWFAAGIHDLLSEFAERHNHAYQIIQVGRSGGYLAMVRGGWRYSSYKSRCTECGQKNCKKVVSFGQTLRDVVRKYFFSHPHWVVPQYETQAEIQAVNLPWEEKRAIILEAKQEYDAAGGFLSADNVCGRCGEEARVNYETPPRETFIYPGKDISWGNDSELDEIELHEMQERVEVLMDFDVTADKVRAAFVAYCRSHEVVEKVVTVEKRVKVIRPVKKGKKKE